MRAGPFGVIRDNQNLPHRVFPLRRSWPDLRKSNFGKIINRARRGFNFGGGRHPAKVRRSGTLFVAHAVRGHSVHPVLENVTGLALQNLTDPLERYEAYSLDFTRFEKGHVLLCDADALGELLGAHFAPRQHDIEIDDNRHAASHDLAVVVSDLDADLENVRKRDDEQRQQKMQEIVGFGPKMITLAFG